MKIYKSMILSAVATLIVAAGPEVAAPMVGADISADAAVKTCKAPLVLQPKGTRINARRVTRTARCVLKKPKLRLRCKGGAKPTLVRISKMNEDGSISPVLLPNGQPKTITRCKKPGVKPKVTAASCQAPKVFRPAGTIIGKTRTGKTLISGAAACVAKPA